MVILFQEFDGIISCFITRGMSERKNTHHELERVSSLTLSFSTFRFRLFDFFVFCSSKG